MYREQLGSLLKVLHWYGLFWLISFSQSLPMPCTFTFCHWCHVTRFPVDSALPTIWLMSCMSLVMPSTISCIAWPTNKYRKKQAKLWLLAEKCTWIKIEFRCINRALEIHSGRIYHLCGHPIYVKSVRLKAFYWKRLLESVRLKAFDWSVQ